jgi:AraC-like DNA-binding protein
MSNLRQTRGDDAALLLRSYAVTHPPNLDIAPRSFDGWDQLAYASRGVMRVETEQGTWVVPPHRAVWIPAGTIHGVRMKGRVAVRTLFFRRGLAKRRMPRMCRAVNVSALVRELVLHACRLGMLHRGVASETRLVHVILDQLETLPTVPLQLPMPHDPRARKAAEVLIAASGHPVAFLSASRTAGASRRTLERLFLAETQMTLGRWQHRLRLIAALQLLAQDHPVTQVALEVGYNSPSAFIAAFRNELGTTPGRYFDPAPSE